LKVRGDSFDLSDHFWIRVVEEMVCAVRAHEVEVARTASCYCWDGVEFDKLQCVESDACCSRWSTICPPVIYRKVKRGCKHRLQRMQKRTTASPN
jgi:hypothetical protein